MVHGVARELDITKSLDAFLSDFNECINVSS
jgi:hypothetical protein